MWEVLLDALIDSLIVFPFIFLIYVAMELIENVTQKEKIEKALKGNFAPIVSAGVGIIPECGFSVMCAKLFDNGLIKIGTLIAGFIATSDEGLVVLISSGVEVVKIIELIAFKIVYAIIIGITLNFTLKKLNNVHVCPEKNDCGECGEKHEKKIEKYLLHPLMHSLKIFAIILAVNVVFGVAVYFIGEEKITEFAKTKSGIQPLFTGLIGLIPNCSSSIILANGYVTGVISFPALLSGLSTNAGVGITMLYRGKKIKKAVLITLALFIFGVGLGYLSMLFGI